jgi:CheY-like chemotaxis protein
MADKILIVDDEREMRQLLSRIVAKNGYDVVEASNGEEAVELATKEDPQVIVMDINMPVVDGIEACRRIKADDRTRLIPVMMVTALEDNKEEAVKAGAEDFVGKPFDVIELSVRLKSLLRIRILTNELDRALAYIQELEKNLPRR